MSNLIASSASLEGAQKLIARFFYTTPKHITLKGLIPGIWYVINGETEIEKMRVFHIKNRYRVERI